MYPLKTKKVLIIPGIFLAGLVIFAAGMVVGRYRLFPFSLFAGARTLLGSSPVEVKSQAASDSAEQGPTPTPELAPEKIRALVEQQNFTNDTAKIDFVRDFVNTNSIHLGDDEFKSYQHNTPLIVEKLLLHYQTGSNPPHLMCDSRSRAMVYILNTLHIISRTVFVFSDDFDSLRSHTFLEVYNRDTHRWEVQDPDYNAYYLSNQTKQRLSALQLLLEAPKTYSPVSSNPTLLKALNEQVIPHYFEAIIYDEPGAPYRGLVNMSRFTIQRTLPDGTLFDFGEYARKQYEGLVPLTISGFDE